ncbi:hypothetical protein LIER_01417 [Lithospermum erythrorhizon]|uniref:MLO-like protein n=1 Tax=Lithospermum erythrorhizon TaxID=34254 RepID=A0AAV3NM17_LITER
MEGSEGKSLSETPTWAVATVVSVLLSVGFILHGCLNKLVKWLDKTKRKALLAALEKIKEELMLFGVLSLLMGHGIIFFAKICVKSSVFSSRFYPCSADSYLKGQPLQNFVTHSNSSISGKLINNGQMNFCPEGHEPFASYESLHQLHRFLFVLGVTHVFYSFIAIVLAMIKIYSWRAWEDQAKSVLLQQGLDELPTSIAKLRRLSTFISHRTSHPWSQHRVLVWLLCFSRQFWSSINQADYNALRLGFISTHELPLTYDFHKYMLRSMEEEFRDIVGISIPLWIFGILCILLNYHGTNIYFWISFVPAILNLVIGTKLHRIVVKLAVEVMEANLQTGFSRFNLRDELFWFGKPRLLLLIIQFISFQNAFEMATYLWLQWENKKTMCLTQNHLLIVIRLTFGVVSQFWCSFITFPLYVIVTQMGSKFKKSIMSENVRKSLHGWRNKVKTKRGDIPYSNMPTSISTTSLDSMVDETENVNFSAAETRETSLVVTTEISPANGNFMTELNCQSNEITVSNESFVNPQYDTYHAGDDCKDSSCMLQQAKTSSGI